MVHQFNSTNSRLAAVLPLVLVIAFWMTQSRTVWAQNTREQGAFEGPGVVLLKHGSFHVGNVHQFGSQVQIELGSNAKVTHTASQIEFIGRDLEEVYQYKRRKQSRMTVGDHFQLTRWCIRAGLIKHAAEHFLEVNKVESDDPRVRQLGVELRDKILADDEFREFAGLGPKPSTTEISPATTSLVSIASAQEMPTLHPLAVSQFTERVQPILINRCSQAACHGFSSTNRLKLYDPKGRNGSRVTSENLRQVLGLLSNKTPMETELIRKAIQSHGIQKAPAISPAETDLLLALQAWVSFVKNPVVTANGSAAWNSQIYSPERSTVGTHAPALTPVVPGSLNLRSVPHSSNTIQSTSGEGFQQPPQSEIDELDARLRQILGEGPGQTPGNTGADPFDPAIFNQQMRERRTSPVNR